MFIFYLLLLIPITAFGAIIGEPRIKCAKTGITIMMDMDTPFKGALFMRSSSDHKSCKADFSSEPSQNITYEFGFDDCPTRRKRQIVKPRGVTMSSVLVVSHHGSIITHKDVAYQIDCFYREEHSKVETLLNVTAPIPQVLSDVPQLPTCNYNVEVPTGSSKNGVVTSSLSGSSPVVTVGESVIHVWTCSDDAPNDVYCMQVHSCTADDGDNDKLEVIDENGCSTDGELVSQIRSTGKSMRAVASSQAFKFADKQIVYFKCQIRVTVKNPADKCPVSNCAASTGTVSRQTRSLFPLLIFQKPQQIYNIQVASPQLLVEPEPAHNHIMSTYKPQFYSYKRYEEPVVNSISTQFTPLFVLIGVILLV